MVFADHIFLYAFLPAFLVLYAVSPRSLRSLTIALGSYLFYGWWRPDFVVLMLFSTAVDYTSGGKIAAARARGETGKAWMTFSIVINLILLAYFKYANFGLETLNHLLVSADQGHLEWAKVILPVGISFYTFQTMSYSIDVYRGDAKPVDSFPDFMAYVALFPQLIAGPIVRYASVADQLRERRHTLAKVYHGVLLFQIGLAKKVLLGDPLGQVATSAFTGESLPFVEAWIGVAAFAFQIYFDFSGYSDMAIGIGLMLGFRFPVNFDSPYRSGSITEFWRRWHISLSSWLRDYLYIPLGGNRGGSIRTYFNLAVTMLLGGLWHGAAWTFILWGAWQGLWLILERSRGGLPFYGKLPRVLRIPITMVIVCFGWVLFAADSLPDAMVYYQSLANLAPSITGHVEMRLFHQSVFVLGGLIVFFGVSSHRLARSANSFVVLFVQLIFALSLAQLHFENHVPFLYYQF
ncbi:MAG: MBOAT family protein [Planctomycetota bacterium]